MSGVGILREKKASVLLPKKKKASALYLREKKQVPCCRGKKSKCLLAKEKSVPDPPPLRWLMVRPLEKPLKWANPLLLGYGGPYTINGYCILLPEISHDWLEPSTSCLRYKAWVFRPPLHHDWMGRELLQCHVIMHTQLSLRLLHLDMPYITNIEKNYKHEIPIGLNRLRHTLYNAKTQEPKIMQLDV